MGIPPILKDDKGCSLPFAHERCSGRERSYQITSNVLSDVLRLWPLASGQYRA